MEPIIDTARLDSLRRTQRRLVVCHVGTSMLGTDPYERYLRGHLPEARYVSLDDDLAAPPARADGRHPLPSAADFAMTLGRLGIAHDDQVVCYDERAGAFASRMVWMLRVIGQQAALLDIDWATTTATGGTTTGSVAVEPVVRDVVEWPDDATADGDEVAAHSARGGVVIDSRDGDRFRGDIEPIDEKAGHIPGAINLPFADNVADGRFRTPDDLRRRFERVGGDPTAIVYCGSGVTACHNALAMEAAGLPRPRVYVGSWSGWSTEPERHIATGDE